MCIIIQPNQYETHIRDLSCWGGEGTSCRTCLVSRKDELLEIRLLGPNMFADRLSQKHCSTRSILNPDQTLVAKSGGCPLLTDKITICLWKCRASSANRCALCIFLGLMQRGNSCVDLTSRIWSVNLDTISVHPQGGAYKP